MRPSPEDTISAIATGAGAIGIVRVSGPLALQIARQVTRKEPRDHIAIRSKFWDRQNAIDSGIVLPFLAPHSYTGEDVVEFHCHGSLAILRAVLNLTFKHGARLAEPGEFTQRAYLNGKMSLFEAEAVADLIQARTDRFAKAAAQSLDGQFGRIARELIEACLSLIATLEAEIDFSEELEIDLSGTIEDALCSLLASTDRLIGDAHLCQLMRSGARVAIVGRPNVGKSSLLNRLAGSDRAIVTDIPGTTRDTIETEIDLNGAPVTFIDTAGYRLTDDPVEAIGVERAARAIESADLVLLLVDASAGWTPDDEAIPADNALRVFNKADLAPPPEGEIGISAKTGEGLDRLLTTLANRLGAVEQDNILLVQARHLETLRLARVDLCEAAGALREKAPPEVVAIPLRSTWNRLNSIVDEAPDDAIIDAIFKNFCIGK